MINKILNEEHDIKITNICIYIYIYILDVRCSYNEL